MNLLIASVTTEQLIDQAVRTRKSWLGEIWVILLLLLAVAVLAFVIILIFRKKPKPVSGTLYTGPLQNPVRRRRRRKGHRPRNPSLAETGGLPPKRPLDQTPPTAT
jgi:hypothetical protein